MLDEPTTYLDIAAGLELMKNLRMLAESGKGIVAVMHDLPLAFTFFNRIIIINDGSIAAEGTPSEICNSDIIKCLFGVHIVKGEANSFYYKL